MKFSRLRALLTAGLIPFTPEAVSAKPPVKEPSKPAAIPILPATPDNVTADSTARWLLEQDGTRQAITLPLAQVIHAASGKRILPFDSSNPMDAAFLAKLGTVMDRILPIMNRANSPARLAAGQAELDEIAVRFEDMIRTEAPNVRGLSVSYPVEAGAPDRSYPEFCVTDDASGRLYYLSVTLYPAGKREEATINHNETCAFLFHPATGARRFLSDGCCLLIGIEYNGKIGNDIAFLNWDVTDVSNVPVRAAITFQADAADVYHPGAVLTDGRKGND